MKKQTLSIILLVLGMIAVAGGVLSAVFMSNYEGLILSSVLFGCGFSLMIANLIYLRNLIKRPEKIKQQKISENDERNIMIREKASHSAGFITTILLSITTIVFSFLKFFIPSLVVAGILFTQIICDFIFNKYYDKRL